MVHCYSNTVRKLLSASIHYPQYPVTKDIDSFDPYEDEDEDDGDVDDNDNDQNEDGDEDEDEDESDSDDEVCHVAAWFNIH